MATRRKLLDLIATLPEPQVLDLVVMHKACLLLFLHRYNRERAILLK